MLAGLDREHQPKPDDNRVRPREEIDRLITDKRRPATAGRTPTTPESETNARRGHAFEPRLEGMELRSLGRTGMQVSPLCLGR